MKRQNTWRSRTENVFDVIVEPKHLKICTMTIHREVFAHTKFGLVRIKRSGVNGGGGGEGIPIPPAHLNFLYPGPDRVKLFLTYVELRPP